MIIHLSRHGQTDCNVKGLLCGNNDKPKLTEQGWEQAKKIGLRYASAGIDAIICSPLERAYETASFLASATGIPRIPMDELREIDFGDIDGLSEEDPVALPHLLKRSQDIDHRFPNGESLREIIDRIDVLLRRLQFSSGSKSAFLFTHGAPLKALLTRLTKTPLNPATNITSIKCPNPIVYRVDTQTGSFEWENVLTGDRGRELIR